MARPHFPLTTPSQRRLLFETWEATGDVDQACRVAHVGRRTFYYWHMLIRVFRKRTMTTREANDRKPLHREHIALGLAWCSLSNCLQA